MDNNKTDNSTEATLVESANLVHKMTQDISKLRDDLWACRNRDVAADDPRVLSLLKEMYDTMVNYSSADLWSNFVDSITGMPDLSVRRYSGAITLTFEFEDIEVPGNIADWEIPDHIYDKLAQDGYLCIGDESEYRVDDYRED